MADAGAHEAPGGGAEPDDTGGAAFAFALWLVVLGLVWGTLWAGDRFRPLFESMDLDLPRPALAALAAARAAAAPSGPLVAGGVFFGSLLLYLVAPRSPGTRSTFLCLAVAGAVAIAFLALSVFLPLHRLLSVVGGP